MSSYVSFFTLKYFNLDLEGYNAFNEKLPGRSKIRIKPTLVTPGGIKFISTSSPPPLSLPVATPGKVPTVAAANIM